MRTVFTEPTSLTDIQAEESRSATVPFYEYEFELHSCRTLTPNAPEPEDDEALLWLSIGGYRVQVAVKVGCKKCR